MLRDILNSSMNTKCMASDIGSGPEVVKPFHAQLSWARNQSQITNNCKYFLVKHSWAWKFSAYIMKMPNITSIFIFISRKKIMLSWVWHEKSFTIPGPSNIIWWMKRKLVILLFVIVKCELSVVVCLLRSNLDHRWLVYHGEFELVFESLRNSSNS